MGTYGMFLFHVVVLKSPPPFYEPFRTFFRKERLVWETFVAS